MIIFIFRKVYDESAASDKSGNHKAIFPISSFCSDFSFWHDKCFDEEELAMNYTTPKNCGVYNQTTIGNFSDCTGDYFYCEKSNYYICKSLICDGSVNCIQGEDEDIDLCRSIFPEQATFLCYEANRTFIDISIYAIPCDGIFGKFSAHKLCNQLLLEQLTSNLPVVF